MVSNTSNRPNTNQDSSNLLVSFNFSWINFYIDISNSAIIYSEHFVLDGCPILSRALIVEKN